eukprot:TRINITY_DN77200_c0_g1_i1.p1 TRINITY_DN77200_c0_g1~~TRINITY_DN77200_c0_g1_i1.p1  ORF type:complete len:218 (+),score=15.15 TRINITY_DN77200_c0_g1_i1:198-851(+)
MDAFPDARRPRRHRRSAAQRRAQLTRAKHRATSNLLGGLREAQQHRGDRPSVLASASQSAMVLGLGVPLPRWFSGAVELATRRAKSYDMHGSGRAPRLPAFRAPPCVDSSSQTPARRVAEDGVHTATCFSTVGAHAAMVLHAAVDFQDAVAVAGRGFACQTAEPAEDQVTWHFLGCWRSPSGVRSTIAARLVCTSHQTGEANALGLSQIVATWRLPW